MLKSNTEIEFRYLVIDSTKINKWLKNNSAEEIYQNRQVDKYYTPAHRNFFDKKIPIEYLRLRSSGAKSSIAYKHWYVKDDEDSGSHCDEFETEIGSVEQIEKIFEHLNFKLLVTVDKTRAAYRFKNFEIVVDEVRDLGTVCEIEIKDSYSDVEEAMAQIRSLATDIGFSDEDRGTDLKLGYAYLLAKKKGVIKSS